MVADATFVIRIPAAMYAEMVAHVVAGYPNETCGLLASKDGQVVKNYPTANAAEHPDDFSIIDPDTPNLKLTPHVAISSLPGTTNSTTLFSRTSITLSLPMPGYF